MKIFNIAVIVAVALLSIAAGAAKVLAVPEEVQFLQSFGFNSVMITLYGIFQLFSGLLLAVTRTRMLGALMAMLGFLLSTILIFITGNLTFGLVSIVPVMLAAAIVYQRSNYKHNKAIK